MVRFNIPIADILGNAYYTYDMTASTYNPTIDTAFTITVTIKSVFGNPIWNKSLTLYKDTTSLGSYTTDEYGRAYWTVTLSDWDNHHFHCNGADLDLMATGWKLMETKASNKVRVYRDKDIIALAVQDSFTFTANANTLVATISSQYAPTYNVTVPFHPQNHNANISITSEGSVYIYNQSSLTSGYARAFVTYPLRSKMP